MMTAIRTAALAQRAQNAAPKAHVRASPWAGRSNQLQAKLRVGAANDPLEHQADRVADAMVQDRPTAASIVQRKCNQCAREEESETIDIRRKQTGSVIGGQGATSAPHAVEKTIQSAGMPLDPAARAYFEPRFGYQFGGVKIHTDAAAADSADQLGARAFTLGRDIAFARGEYNPFCQAGRRLIAHELAHVVQQSDGADHGPTLRRALKVKKPGDNIPDPTGKGVKQTNAATVGDYLATLCPAGTPVVDAAGDVQLASNFCKEIPDPGGGAPTPSPAKQASTATGCGCLCDMTASANVWTIEITDSNWPQTNFDDHGKAETAGSGGTGGVVTAPSPNTQKKWGAATVSGKRLDIAPWLVLGHELCGHGWLGDQGGHAPDSASPRGSGGHQATVARENLIRAEHGLEARGGWRDPWCGESYFRKKASGDPQWSGYLAECKRWRKEYNKKNGTKYKISEAVPP